MNRNKSTVDSGVLAEIPAIDAQNDYQLRIRAKNRVWIHFEFHIVESFCLRNRNKIGYINELREWKITVG